MKLQDFYERLNVHVTLQPVQQMDIEQVAYLTQHTADFHLTALQRSADELGNLLARKALEGWVVEVRDRFGEYGMAGMVLSAIEKDVMRLDTFLLGCHVLGKRVEYITLKKVAQIARQYRCTKMQLCYRATARNGLSRTFITSIGGPYIQSEPDGLSVLLPLEHIEKLSLPANSSTDHTPEHPAAHTHKHSATSLEGRERSSSLLSHLNARKYQSSPIPAFIRAHWQKMPALRRSDILTGIATNFQTAEQIQAMLAQKKQQHQPIKEHDDSVRPQTSTEQTIASIWQTYLGVSNIGLYDDFFRLGGHSLLATQVISRMRDAFAVELPLRDIFEAPTVSKLAKRVEAARRESQGIPVPPIKPLPRDQKLPLSFAQQRLWFLDQLQPGSTAYNVPVAIQLKGTLHVTALKQAFNEIVRRHEALRTNFVAVDTQPFQVIAATLDIALPVVDLMHLPVAERETTTHQLAIDEAQRPFDLTHDPLTRTTLLRLDTQEHWLLLTLHHIVFDGWSIGILIHELGALYTAFSIGAPSPLPTLPVQYADYAIWQLEWLRDEVYDRQLNYWKQQLVHAPPLLELPTDHPRPAIQSFHGANYRFQLSLKQTDTLKNLSQQEGVTLFVTLLATFKVLLQRYSAKNHIVVGTPIANRRHPELEGLIGFFANTLVLHTDLSGDPSFREVLQRVQNTALSAYDHQDLPFEKLVADLRVERNSNYNPLFQVLFVLQNTPPPIPSLGGLSVTPLDIQRNTAILDLALSMEDTLYGLQGLLEYNTDLFNANTINQMMLHFQTLLGAITSQLDTTISRLPLLTATERQQLLTSPETEARKRKKLSAQVKSLLKSKESLV